MDSNTVDQIEAGDAGYRPFPLFAKWLNANVNLDRWQSHRQLLENLGSFSAEKLARARDAAKRAAAIDTGAIEGLYDLDRGVTITIATQNAMWEAAFEKQTERVRALIECQLGAYDFVIDFATRRTPIAEAWIRTLHSKLCAAQSTYQVHTAVGLQDHALTHGAYKNHPNHVLLPSGAIHSYAPVIQTAPEMQRLCDELQSNAFASAHPVIQAAYAHHALTCIHPFQDGNGRVARALASVFLYRDASIPLLVLVEHRAQYLDCLSQADINNYQSFVDFVFQRSLDAFLLVKESLRTADLPSLTDVQRNLKSLLFTRGGYSHQEVDVAGQSLLAMFEAELDSQMTPLNDPSQLTIGRGRYGSSFPPAKPGYRNPVGTAHTMVQVTLRAASPSTQNVSMNFFYQVPVNCSAEDLLVIRCAENDLMLETPFGNVHPIQQTVAKLQLSLFVQTVLTSAIHRLTQMSKDEFQNKGYLPRDA